MSVATLFNIPKSAREQAEWSLANAASHIFIIERLEASKPGLQLTRYLLDPVNEPDVQNWLLRHQLMHSQFDQLLGIGGNDFSTVNPAAAHEQDYLWLEHANEHILAENLVRSAA